MHNNARETLTADAPRVGAQAVIAVAGAGSIGCYVGGCLGLAGRRVTFLMRPALAEAIGRYGMRISDLDGADRTLAAGTVELTSDPASAFARADVVLVTVKSGATEEMAGLIARHARPGAIVVSLQNGVGNVDRLRAQLEAKSPVVGGMVPCNVVQTREADGRPRFHRATSGTLLIGSGVAGLCSLLDVAGVAVAERANIAALQWGKLLFNLNNPVNALSGLPLRDELLQRGYRRCFAALIDEAIAALNAAGIAPAQLAALPARKLPTVLRLPNWLFTRVAARMLRIDEKARSSMADDLALGRRTEVDAFCGEVVRLAQAHGRAAPRNAKMVELLDGGWPTPPARLSSRALCAALGL